MTARSGSTTDRSAPRTPRARTAGSRTAWIGVLPLLAFVAVFLLLPTILVAVQSFTDTQNQPTLANVRALRRTITAVCGVLAQFGGVTLAFAFIATVGTQGFLTLLLAHGGLDIAGGWLYRMPGLVLVYSYFQIPLMVLVFLPALDGVRPQWREACEPLGGTSCSTSGTWPSRS